MTGGLEILLVEDDADTRSNLCDILELDSHHVVAVASLAEARRILSLQKVGLVILDRRLPDGTAEQFLPELKRLLPDAHTIIVTGYTDLDSTISAFRHGATDYILKPINADALRNTVTRIVQQRNMELELHHEQRFADLILSTAEAVVLVLDLEGRVVRFNPFLERITGWTESELVGKDWFKTCIPDSDHDRIREVFLLTSNDLRTVGIVNPVVARDGSLRQIRWSNTTLGDDIGVATAVLAVGVDITDNLAAQEHAARSEQLAAIGQTMAALAHESRNALQRIHAGLELLELDLQERPESLRDLQTVKRAANDLNASLEEVRSFAAPIRIHRGSCDLRSVYQRAWRNLSTIRSDRAVDLIESADLIESGDTTDWICQADETVFEQVFRNLFENAIAACSDPVKILIHRSAPSDDSIEFLFSDNGPGLSAEQRGKLFEPFFTTKSGGTGLGLSIVSRIIEAHQGSIALACHDQGLGGATFRITIPAEPHSR